MKSTFEDIIRTRFEDHSTENLQLLREYINFASSNQKNVDILIDNSKKELAANLYALEKLILLADKKITVITSNLVNHPFSQPRIRRLLAKWLAKGNKKLNILLKDKSKYEDSNFYIRLRKVLGNSFDEKVSISYSDESTSKNCLYNAVVNDTGSLKIKDLSNKKENVIVNYNSPSEAEAISEEIECLMLLGDQECTRSSNLFEISKYLEDITKNNKRKVQRITPSDFSPATQIQDTTPKQVA